MTGFDALFEPTPAQQAVITQPYDARTLATAGPGAGKTTTLSLRLEHLIEVEELDPADILVLTFSQAAVQALSGRADRLSGPTSRVRVQTFDAWATALLLQTEHTVESLSGLDHDSRIELATDAIAAGVVEKTEQGFPAHVVIDEVQDLMGVRRLMVEALLERFTPACGLTVVGDIAQAVYGFQVADLEERNQETGWFLTWVRNWFTDDLVEIHLGDNFRARTADAAIALSYGDSIRQLPTDRARAEYAANAVHDSLRRALETVPDFGDLDDPFVQASLREFEGSSAILGRTNAEVLLLSESLNRSGVPHRLQRSARARPAPAWVAALTQATEMVEIAEDRFLELSPNLPLPAGLDPRRAWRTLRGVAGTRNGRLNLDALVRAVAERRLPEELSASAETRLVLSTVHRAKGLEFDRVLVVKPRALTELDADRVDPSAEVRALFVAMTRPRDDLFRLTRPATWMMRKDAEVDRWYVSGGRHNPSARSGMECTEFDVCHEAPAMGVGLPGEDSAEIQQYLATSVHEGDGIELRRLHDLPESTAETPPYGIFHQDRLIGETSRRFRSDLWRILGGRRTYEVRRWPCRVTGLRIDTVETAAGFAALTERLGLGGRGAWLAPRLCGLGRFDWTHADQLPEGHHHP
ncbi:UvrD-helicase domain-containing protein [Catellatospora bangladeshensis]|uniref:DNA 3'-5' helicase n=1 Tax=Catellatospora bangladeshensis TaxID=310355 RepID=A0A8J3JDW5_9ACTN|nr:UvrD-helicase domain-containing protein [Catellatospora bangladeshensis]GIF83132.1 hypothetical protein Cba03nite_44810 [Catellatospora bangladeshensis]